MRPVDSLISASSVLVASVLATHSRPAAERRTVAEQLAATRSHHATSTPAAASGGASSQSCVDAVLAQPVAELVLAVGDGRARPRSPAGGRSPPQRVELDELCRR